MSKTTIKKYNVAGTEQWSQVLSDERAPSSANYQPAIDDIGNVYSFAKKDVVDDYTSAGSTQNLSSSIAGRSRIMEPGASPWKFMGSNSR